MLTKLLPVFASLLAVQPAAADFLVYLGASNDFAGGAGPGGGVAVGSPEAIFFNNPPSCDDKYQQITGNANNDASSGGYACDGCDSSKALSDQVPDRFEVNEDIFDNGPEHITLYKKDGDSTEYGLYDTDMNSLGDCYIPDDRPDWTCLHAVIGVDSVVLFFQCKTDMTIKDSN